MTAARPIHRSLLASLAATLLLAAGQLQGQRVTWEPLLPWAGGAVTIIYDANKFAALASASQIYIHLGRNGWQGVTSPENDPPMTATNTSGIWSYDYDIPLGTTVIDFVFQDKAGTWDNNGGQGIDWHIEVFAQGLTAVLLQPEVDASLGHPHRSPVIVGLDDTVHVVGSAAAIGTGIDSLVLKVAGTQVAASREDSLTHDFIAADHGNGIHTLTYIAADTLGNFDSLSFAIVVSPTQASAAPPAGTQPGITLDGANVTLALFAPYKEFVYVIGDFIDWKIDGGYQMNRYDNGADSTLWWLTFSQSPGVHTFQYLIDDGLRIADPYTSQILDEGDDPWISAATYPNLTPYPSGLTHGHVSTFETNTNPYLWQNSDSYVRAPQEELIIYELLIRDFTAAHDYSTIIDSLDYLANLGINAIELLPNIEFPGNMGWGYNTSYHFALDKYYGPPETFKALVDSAHGRGIAVIMDIVLNHINGASPLVRLYIDTDNGRPSALNPWINPEDNFENPVPGSWGPDMNHESVHTRYYVDRITEYWMTEYQIDGFRFDFTKGWSNTWHPDVGAETWGSNYDPARIANLKRMADAMWAIDPTAYVILEHLAENREDQELADYGMLLWGNMNYAYNEATMGYPSDLSGAYYKSRDWTKAHLITYMESHDEERLNFKNLAYGNSSGGYSVKELPTALSRLQQIGGFFFTLPGPKMIWMFGEIGYDFSIDYNGRLGPKPIRWDYFDDSGRRKVYDTWAALLKLRAEHATFRSPETVVDMALSTSKKRISLSHPEMDAVILGNFSVTAGIINPAFPDTGVWYEFFSGESITVTNAYAAIDLPPGALRIFTDLPTFTPAGNLLDIDMPPTAQTPTEFALYPAFPNPFNPSTTLQFDLPEAGEVTLVIFDLRGREVAQAVNGYISAGQHRATWTGRDNRGRMLPSGLYIARLVAANGMAETRKLVLLK